ncbi:hypothetical protein JG688_00013873 [Phytophthora aleatoria]|uniref:Uncharacterized protein n=1 Tax=Phytophthora aleatoria TaxID=2496075 RepID=A0A8J5IXT3_9STRA|nr:hypothetical protein JG688_00013873 [Phytophthora aleatoria]
MHPQEMDSMNLASARSASRVTKPAKWQDQGVQAVSWMAYFIVVTTTAATTSSATLTQHGNLNEDLLLDRITQVHQLIAQVKEAQRTAELAGTIDSLLATSQRKYQRDLQRYEDQLEAMD